MSGSTFGKHFKITTFGESHGNALGVIIDGCPSNISISLEDIMKDMNRRKPGNTKIGTARSEDDQIEILSGVFEGKTTGTPICLMLRNTNQKSHDYNTIKDIYRPSHADYGFDAKYGIRDYRGGGRSSGRETSARVAAGAVAKKVLSELGITVTAYTRSIGPVTVKDEEFHLEDITQNPVSMPNNACANKALDYIQTIKKEEDSIGGIIECIATGVKAGIGEPVFNKLDAVLAHAVMSIGAVKAFEVGLGTSSSSMKGSVYNDSFYVEGNDVKKHTNHSGGILGGISDGSDIFIRAHFKPTPSISKVQNTITTNLENTTVRITGRHDPVIVPRAVVVVEAMVAIALLDSLLVGITSNIDNVKKLFLSK
jgi:chorismate synthase